MLKIENQIPQSRFWMANVLTVLLMLVLVLRYFQLQIYNYEIYKNKADVNRIRAVTVEAPRGAIFDRNGIILVDNEPTFVLSVIPEEIEDIGTRFQVLEQCTGIDSSLLDANYSKYYRGRFVPARLAKDLTFTQISHIEENRLDLSGILYHRIQERVYPTESDGSHIFGYLKEVDRRIRKKIIDKHNYEFGDLIGWQGLEKQYENLLRGSKGVQYYQVDAFGREMGILEPELGMSPEPGKNLLVTFDGKLQGLVEKELSGYRGSIIVSIPETGEILASASSPSFDLELFRGLTLQSEWDKIISDKNRPLMNRITNGLYPPGSTLKLLTAIVFLEHGLIDPKWKTICTGSYRYGGRDFGCWNEYGHGEVDFHKAITQSCNVYFFKVVQNSTLKDLTDMSRNFGFGQHTGIDFPQESIGVVPDKEYMNNKYTSRGWSKGAMLNLAIGQGDILVTPLQMANYINIIATHGKAGQLHFKKRDDIEYSLFSPEISNLTWQTIENTMISVIKDPNGTGRFADPGIDGLTIAGKTGSSENPHGEPHAWFVAYGKKNDKTYSIIIILENAGHGGEVAAPIVRDLFKYLFTDRQFAENG